jgi:predicted alpha/beta-hydrolase family hydrolase
MSLAYLAGGPAPATVRLLYAHGAGSGMDTPFMEAVAGLLAERNIATLRFEFG